MAVENLKAGSITSLDAIPALVPTAGAGSPGALLETGDFVTVSAAATNGSVYRLARVPSNVKVKQVLFESDAQGAGAADISVYYSSSTTDGTNPGVQGLVVPTTGAGFFATAIALAAAVAQSLQTNESTNYTLAKRNQPFWQALGLPADPGGFFDIAAVLSTSVTTGTGRMGIRVQYVT